MKDGDIVGLCTSQLIYDCVVEDEYPVININDGAKGDPMELDEDDYNIHHSIVKASGNLIGKISMMGACLNARVKSIENCVWNNQVAFYSEVRNYACSLVNVNGEHPDNDKDLLRTITANYMQENGIVHIYNYNNFTRKMEYNFTNEQRREFIKQAYMKHKESFGVLLVLSQIAIDYPKTLCEAPEWLNDMAKPIKKYSKPYFLFNLGKVTDYTKLVHWTNWKKNPKFSNVKQNSNYEDIFASYIYWEFVDKLTNRDGKNNIDNMITRMKYNHNVTGEINEVFGELAEKHREVRNELLKDNRVNPQNKAENTKKLNELDLEILNTLESLNLSDEQIIDNVIAHRSEKLKGAHTGRFIRMFCWKTYYNKCMEVPGLFDDVWSYVEDTNGDIDWMYKKYTRKDVKGFVIDDITVKERIAKGTSLGRIIDKVGIGGLGDTQVKDTIITIKLGEYVTKDGEVKTNYNVVLDGIVVGYVYPNCADKVEYDKQYRVIDIKYNRNSATTCLEVLE